MSVQGEAIVRSDTHRYGSFKVHCSVLILRFAGNTSDSQQGAQVSNLKVNLARSRTLRVYVFLNGECLKLKEATKGNIRCVSLSV